ncbi:MULTISPECIES: rRNA maturation RNase YbeY [unclassified Marinitoga]|uniref:rRNA maturation RNase YbeY n=1 Tax=unclassified Marinitoga TaxID=2640159 RepID=UPI000640F0BF|nr:MULTISPECIES: rRNA maturation RNase YbeY [unclassified Marinitoga]KLO25071.1 rRNA maturation factor [Marinitoga sp. 1155]NUU98642.1 rRNA maturation factor [Marinitoga sp. 1154]
MKINIFDNQEIENIDIKKVENITKKVLLSEIGDEDYELNIVITDNETIKEYNEKYRNKIGPTDVLSFEYGVNEDIIGEIIISVEKIKEQAPEFNNTFEEEFFYILIHGILHICGYDHLKEEEKKKMFKIQDEYYKNLFKTI